MADPKPLASLSAGLLARKGAARPAMRRQVSPNGAPMHVMHGQDDLGWNDMGYDVDPQGMTADDHHPTDPGLSPMARLHDAEADEAALSAIDAAVSRGIVAPLNADNDVPDRADAPPVVVVQQRLAREMALPAADPVPAPVVEPEVVAVVAAPPPPARAKPAPRVRAGSRGAYAFTLRLDPERHLRLRLATATGNRSAQHILVALLDAFLADQPEIDAFAARFAAKS